MNAARPKVNLVRRGTTTADKRTLKLDFVISKGAKGFGISGTTGKNRYITHRYPFFAISRATPPSNSGGAFSPATLLFQNVRQPTYLECAAIDPAALLIYNYSSNEGCPQGNLASIKGVYLGRCYFQARPG